MDLKPSFLIGHTEVRYSPLLFFTLDSKILNFSILLKYCPSLVCVCVFVCVHACVCVCGVTNLYCMCM